MTKFLGTVCKTVGVVLSVILLPVRILMVIVLGIIEFPTTIFASKFEIGFKEYFSMLFNDLAMGLKSWWNAITVLYAKD